MGQFADVPQREADWLNEDLSAFGLAPLAKTLGGPFDLIAPYPRSLSARSRQLFVYRARSFERRIGNGIKQAHHELVVRILWEQVSPDEKAHIDQAGLDVALDALVDRIRGLPPGTAGTPAGDRSHGGRFWSVAVAEQVGGDAIEVVWPDPMAAVDSKQDAPGGLGRAYDVQITYTAIDSLSPA